MVKTMDKDTSKNVTKGVEVFKAGQHKPMNGRSKNFPVSMLHEVADNYDREKHNAPIVVGHPKMDAPAYGWVERLYVENDTLKADIDQVDEAFVEMVKQGRYKKISASFFGRNSPDNPIAGKYMLKHVGFLGAAAPAVKGLKPAEFSGSGLGVIEFGEDDMIFAEKIAAKAIQRYENQRAMEILMDKGKLLPCHAEDMLSFVESLDNSETVSFASGDMGSRDWFLNYLEEHPSIVSFGEYAPLKEEQRQDDVLDNMPEGYRAEHEDIKLHASAKALASEQNISFSEAVKRLET